jgi:hypothetical protein
MQEEGALLLDESQQAGTGRYEMLEYYVTRVTFPIAPPNLPSPAANVSTVKWGINLPMVLLEYHSR